MTSRGKFFLEVSLGGEKEIVGHKLAVEVLFEGHTKIDFSQLSFPDLTPAIRYLAVLRRAEHLTFDKETSMLGFKNRASMTFRSLPEESRVLFANL